MTTELRRPPQSARRTADIRCVGTPIRLVLADDHRMLRHGLRLAMEEAGFEVVGEAGDGEEAVRLVSALRPDVVLMDVTMPLLDGIEATRLAVQRAPGSHVVMLTMHGESDVMARALQAGAVGYLVKDCSTEEVVAAVRMAAAGYLLTRTAPGPASVDGRGIALSRGLTERECDVLSLVAKGMSNAEIASSLTLSEHTVKSHVQNMLGKLRLRNRIHAVIYAFDTGIAHPTGD
jgi:DNA-binding NarL/FixJ family response regulator